ncbi:uncharacterized protein [Physcomitrium patens]|uniref:Protein kinase domain-containing protein n=1 Tax=Physcomitrium patens TaxID=3218 RepID=A0A2K1IY87_PHYPA|nr:mitogen-activated protein kinase kinase kinase YODA-like [Physcomitrium patens]PNR34235.1 hypothetical protein PHYPA_024052 [Physcomitrium patens]|eukprot:XP_024403862.1 mitogen-activated protein kinase kinase kinase YODA-like [Physcomitrella patens]
MASQSWIRGNLLGAGAFGSVNLAINRENGEVFAVKSVQVKVRYAGSEAAVRAIENEIDMLQRLDSKYVVRCLGSDWTEEGGQLMRNLFLEYMPEGCLTDFVKQFTSSGALDEQLLRTYTRSIVEGIDYLHSNGIVHCDIKGKNILIGNGNVKLTDFGSSKRVGAKVESDVMNCAAKVNGTPLWMAPEVVRQVEQGPPSDIWSLGCTVVEMATGRAPWSHFANHFAALYHIGCTDQLPEVPASLSAEAHDFLSHCFQRDSSKRWTSAQLLQHPFLTSRFVPSPIAVKAPASPINLTHFSALSDSDPCVSFEDSVLTLAAPAPSLSKRGLVSAQPEAQKWVEENWWSTPASPDSGPWIVVRSPRSSFSPSIVSPDTESSTSSIETPIVGRDTEVCEISCDIEVSEISTEGSTSASSLHVSICFGAPSSLGAVVGVSYAENSLLVSHFDITETDFGFMPRGETSAAFHCRSLSASEKSVSYSEEGESPSTYWNSQLSTVISTISDSYFKYRKVYQSNAQILHHWYHVLIRGGLRRSNRDFECWKSDHTDHFMSQIPYLAPLNLQKHFPLHFYCILSPVCVFNLTCLVVSDVNELCGKFFLASEELPLVEFAKVTSLTLHCCHHRRHSSWYASAHPHFSSSTLVAFIAN